ncbi:preprotein translocase subunit SecD [Halovenus sp. WSH3]|uniref:Protein-export membrane protein SecD n=1 Tax=Halovenus carboxidivorans TaxID=2692199 RepID=A0A6B0TCF4_9EURY|nr:preprotein translocase subunit SecD [Halovenus carboxidivorans]MXR52590.1 preprotein translocase subunit SecD [Halovenus carboxidivorans]
MIDVRDNWRVLMLVVLCALAAVALFGPLGPGAGGNGATDNQTQAFGDPTNLQYGLDLAGGTRVRGQLVGQTAEEVQFDTNRESEITSTIVSELQGEYNVEPVDVQTRPNSNAIELYKSPDQVPQSAFVAALNAAGLDVSEDDISVGVTDTSREQAVRVLETRIDETGLGGSSVTTTQTPSGEHFIVVEVPGADRERVEELIGSPGRVQVMLGYPNATENATEPNMEVLLEEGDFQRIPGATPASASDTINLPHVRIQLTDEAAQRFQERMVETGFTQNGVRGPQQCRWEEGEEPDPNQYCLYTVVDGNITSAAGLNPDLANTLESGNFDGGYVITTNSMEEARQLEVDLRAGALPSELRIESTSYISPSTAQIFKPLALLTAFLAWLAVSLVVYVWYRDVRVAVPMLVTAASEVFLLLGFAAAIGMALDLSHIAGLIAVIGTGLDDLIIMADEILQRRDEVKTGRVFQSRFRKAFWIIGMAAGTTIIAMSPLAVLSLGDLRGFAIVTIVGVLIGVLVTRPAYGDVLRKLMLDDVKRK